MIPKKVYEQFDHAMKQINAISAGNIKGNVVQSKVVALVRAIVLLQQRDVADEFVMLALARQWLL